VTKPRRDPARALLEDADASLLELVDNVLTKGVVIHGEIVLGLVNARPRAARPPLVSQGRRLLARD
jgi:gas vesicle protein GvpA/GvpJ/GvpM family